MNSPNATYYLKGRGYTNDDFARMSSAVAGSDLGDFFARHVRGVEVLPYDEALAYAGLRLVKTAGAQRPDYRIEEIPNAPAEARRLRTAWLTGR